jgi:hypothetical protein
MRAVWAAGLVLACSSVHASVDHLFDYNGLSHRSDLNGIGQTFIGEAEQLLDASILLCEPDPNVGSQWWPAARFQVRLGLPGNLDGTSGNVLFNSSIIDFSTLPVVATAFNGDDLFELKLSELGYTTPLDLIDGQTYSLVIWDPGTTGTINYAEHQPSTYPDGGAVGHNRSYANGFWPDPSGVSDHAFKVVMTPEPGSALVWVGAMMLAATRRRGSSGSR